MVYGALKVTSLRNNNNEVELSRCLGGARCRGEQKWQKDVDHKLGTVEIVSPITLPCDPASVLQSNTGNKKRLLYAARENQYIATHTDRRIVQHKRLKTNTLGRLILNRRQTIPKIVLPLSQHVSNGTIFSADNGGCKVCLRHALRVARASSKPVFLNPGPHEYRRLRVCVRPADVSESEPFLMSVGGKLAGAPVQGYGIQ